MPDYSMCRGDGCSAKESCARYRWEPSVWQSYFGDPPGKDESCKYFLDVKNWNIPWKKSDKAKNP